MSPTLNYAKVTPSTHSSSASHVAAELVKGKLNPADSKPGDTVVVILKDDVKANGSVVLKKGTSITGVVRRVVVTAEARAMMELEWVVPEVQGRSGQSLSIALQSVMQMNVVDQHETGNAAQTKVAVRPVAASFTDSRVSGKSNPALMSMPSVIAADSETSSTIESNLGSPSSGQLFKVGQGRLLAANGSHQSVNIFSHLNNDTVITSATEGFEISTGAQMQLLVGVYRR